MMHTQEKTDKKVHYVPVPVLVPSPPPPVVYVDDDDEVFI